MKKIITAGGKSVIYCGQDSFGEKIKQAVGGRKTFVITDSNVNKIYGELIYNAFGKEPDFIFPAGERSKTHKTLLAILDKMVQKNITRSSVVIAFGGGVVGDIAGLAASLYMRGVHLVQIPTTLLSQVDSSVGGKTAVDFKNCKNLIGAFYQPETVIIDPAFLNTLPKREIRCGLGEIIKYAALNAEIYDTVLQNKSKLFTKEFFEQITYLCVKYKAEVVDADEKEVLGLRKCLNLGHTTGHAFELYYKKRSHGEFVLIGMLYELYIAGKYGIVEGEYKNSLTDLIKKVIKVPNFDGVKNAGKFAIYDKKNITSKQISVIVPKCKGEYEEVFIPCEEYLNLIEECAKSLCASAKKFAVIGRDVSKSSSPQMHSFIAKNLGYKIKYEKLSVPEEGFSNSVIKALKNLDGFNVTIPYKLKIIPYLSELCGDAKTFGSVNTVHTKTLKGYNTDGLGFMLMLKNEGVAVNGKSVLLLGAGGAGRSVAKKLLDDGATVHIYDRSFNKASAIAEEFAGVIPLEKIVEGNYDIIVNATGVGMHESVGVSPVDSSILRGCSVAVDLIYVPEKSEFLRLAEQNNAKIINGKAMLFYQAYFADCVFFGIEPCAKQAKKLFEEYLKGNTL